MIVFRQKFAGLLSGVQAAFALAFAACFVFGPGTIAAQAASQVFGHVEIGQRAPNFVLTGSDGKSHALTDYPGKIVVLEWTSPICNYTKAKYASGQMQALQRKAADKGVVWLSINTANVGRPGYLTPAKARARVSATHARVTAFLLDSDTRVGRLYGAKSTPSFFIIGTNGVLAYQGAIDDDVYANGHPTRNYVQETLDALTAGRAPQVTETRPYGCTVDYANSSRSN
ncbi:MAG: redoxin domain-containing protein [Alphaproteobacteria bacterium]